MSTKDRLAAARARRHQAAAQTHEMEDMSTAASAPSTEAAGAGPSSDSTAASAPLTEAAGAGPSSDFFSEVSSIQEGIERVNANVSQIAALHLRILNVMDPEQTQDLAKLDQLADETRALSNGLKDRIKALERTSVGPDAQMRTNRVAFVRAKFLEAIQDYQRVEQKYRVKSRQRIERQLKIVKPDATSEEVATVAEGGGQQIFTQALSSSSRYGESRMAFREVQERQEELKKMERTLTELAQLFVDMGTLIEQQQDAIETVETTAQHVEQDTEKATQHMWKAVISARNYRKGRWICFGIFMVILIIIAIVLAVTLTKH